MDTDNAKAGLQIYMAVLANTFRVEVEIFVISSRPWRFQRLSALPDSFGLVNML